MFVIVFVIVLVIMLVIMLVFMLVIMLVIVFAIVFAIGFAKSGVFGSYCGLTLSMASFLVAASFVAALLGFCLGSIDPNEPKIIYLMIMLIY